MNFNEYSTEDLPEYEYISNKKRSKETRLLIEREKLLLASKDSNGNQYFQTCKHCGFTYMPMSEKSAKQCPKCKGEVK